MDDFIRHCWNSRVPDADFIQEIHQRYNDIEIIELMCTLLQFCGQPYQTTPFLFPYLFSIIQDNPFRVFSIISKLNCNQEIGFIKLFSKYGDSIFNLFEEINNDAANFALKSLNLVLKYFSNIEDSSLYKEAIDKLSQSSMFAILIASARLYFPDEFKTIQKQFEVSISLDNKIPQINLSQLNLISALFKKTVMNYHTSKSIYEITYLCSTCLSLLEMSDNFYDYQSSDILEKLFMLLVEQFFESPSLQTGFLITNHLVHKILNSQKTEFDNDEIGQLIDRIELDFERDNETQYNSPYVELCSPRIKNDYSIYYPKGITPKELKTFLTTPPPSIDNEDIFSILFQYPMFISSFVDYFISLMTPTNILVCSNLANQIMEHISDFILLLKTQKKFIAFLKSLNTFLRIVEFENLEYSEAFTHLWYLFLIIFRTPLQYGSKISGKICEEFLKESDESLHPFLKLFIGMFTIDDYLQLEKELMLDEVTHMAHPLNQCIGVLRYLMATNDIDSIINVVETHNFLLPSVLIWGIKMQDPSVIKLASVKMPSHALIDTLFYQMMPIKGKSMTWLAGINHSKVDYDFMVTFPPRDISNYQFIVSNGLMSLAEIRPININKLMQSIMMWRSIIQVYGLNSFIIMLIDLLLWNTQTRSDPVYQKTIFLYAACILIFTCENDQETLMDVFTITIDFITAGYEQAGSCDSLADFLAIIAIPLKEKWKEELMPLLHLNEPFMDEERNTPKISFAINFLKASLHIQSLRQLITVDMLHPIYFENDCQTAIDFFISKEMQSNEILDV